MTALLADRLKRRRSVRVWPLLAGAVMPDVPLWLLTLGLAALRRLTGAARPGEGLYAPGFDDLFFRDPVWVALHNSLHAPLVLLGLAAAGWYAWRQQHRWGVTIWWFAIGCGLHALVDVFTHYHDGPLLLFPLDWEYRFPSAISYWHPDHYGRLAGAVEQLFDLGVLLYFAVVWGRRGRRPTSDPLAVRGNGHA